MATGSGYSAPVHPHSVTVPESDSDDALVARAKAGDSKAFDVLILRHGNRLFGLVYQMTGNREDTHDQLQETFAKAYRGIGRFRGASSFSTWVHQIAVNLTLNHLKRRKRRPTLSLDELEEAGRGEGALEDLSAAGDPQREMYLGELREKLNVALGKLSKPHRLVVTMFDIQGMPHAEIARILKVSEGTVRSRLHYAHLQLQAFLQDDWNQKR